MLKGILKEGLIIELPQEAKKRFPLKEGDLLRVRLLNGKEVVLEKPKGDWAERFKTFLKKIEPKMKKVSYSDIAGETDKAKER
jgi:hypothetical protein